LYCPNCGDQNPETSKFCQSCGAKFSDSLAPPTSDQLTKCPQCSGENQSGAKLCSHCGTLLPEQSSAVPPAGQPFGPPPRVDYAGFWRRFVAFIIDMIAIGIVTSLIRWITGGSTVHNSPMIMNSFSNFGAQIFSFSNFASIAIGWLYYALMESSTRQATLGKMALGLFVTDLNGKRLSFARASGRHFGKIVSAMTLTIGYLMAGFTARKQALHDMIAGCLVLVRQ